MNNFMIDKKFGEKYEEYFAERLGIKMNECNKDDEGVDIYGYIYNTELEIYGDVYIDVKSYRRPLYVKSFKGVFIETISGKYKRNLGWYLKENKTTHYIMVVDCYDDEVKYNKSYLIERKKLIEACDVAIELGDIENKKTDGAEGFILPYKYLEEYGIELG